MTGARAGASVLDAAIAAGHAPTVRALLGHGARTAPGRGAEPRLCAAVRAGAPDGRGGHTLVAERLLAAGARTNTRDAAGDTALVLARRSQREDTPQLIERFDEQRPGLLDFF